MQLTEYDYFLAALSEANYMGMELEDVLRAAIDSESAEELDERIQSISVYWNDLTPMDAF